MRGGATLENRPERRREHLASAAIAAGLNFIADAAVGDAAIWQGGGRDGGDEEGGEEVGFGEEHRCGTYCAWVSREQRKDEEEEEEEGDVL